MGRKLTNNEFIQKSIEIHGDKYDYSSVKYINSRTKVKIICREHGIFEQLANDHIQGKGCKECSIKKINTIPINDIIIRANKTHNNKYIYSKLTGIINSINTILCPIHGEFKQRLADHLNGHGCPLCGGSKLRTKSEFTKKAMVIYSKYDYTKFNYINSKTKGIIICPVHGEFEQTPTDHLNGHACKHCNIDTRSRNKIEKHKLFFKYKSSYIHDNKYDYTKFNYTNSKIKSIIICPIHGEFEQTPSSHLNGHGCSKCNLSKGEQTIINILEKNNISYISQKKFKKCKNKRILPFDFYLPNYNICIEYDGEQHFNVIDAWGGKNKLKAQQLNDNIKTEYCETNNIKLIRIRYDENIEEILKKRLK